MKILGISSATKVISIGLLDDEKVLAETTISDIRAERVLFYAQEAGIKPDQIEAIAVAKGPGSYSGLRGGLSTAKTLAQTLEIPLVGLSTLEAMAYNLVDIEGTMAVILDARSDEYNFALFGASKGKLERLTDDLVLNLDHIAKKLKAISGEMYLVGNIREIKGNIRENNGRNFHFADEIHFHPYGINVAKIGLQRINAKKLDDPLKLVPQYSHQPNFKEYSRKTS